MEWWNVFKQVRRAVFAFMSIATLGWSVVLSVYLSKEWVHFSTLQRSIVLALIIVNAMTSLLLYLMIVVVFRMWKELLRMLVLIVLHSGTSVLFTLFGSSFSCAIFHSNATCKVADLVFFSSAWSITGLLVGYTIYLCIIRIPSMSSINSATHLLHRVDTQRSPRPASPASVYSQESMHSRTAPRRLFVVNRDSLAQPFSSTRGSIAEPLRRNASYGATNAQDRTPASSVLPSRFSTSTIASIEHVDPAPPKRMFSLRSTRSSHLLRQPSAPAVPALPASIPIPVPAPVPAPVPRKPAQRQPPRRVQPPPLSLSPKPFTERLSQHGTLETAPARVSSISAPANPNLVRGTPYMQGSYGTHRMPHAHSAGIPSQPRPSMQYNRSASPQMQMYAGPQVFAGYPAPYVTYGGQLVRSPSATPSVSSMTSMSIHSMSPSIHFTNAFGNTRTHPAALTPAHPFNMKGNAAGSPPPAHLHLRSLSDPLFRPSSADPHMGPYAYHGGALPGPYHAGAGAGAEIRRYGSLPHVRSGSYGLVGYGGGAGAYGAAGQAYYTAGWTGHGAQLREKGIARGGVAAASVTDLRWREEVMKAAAGRG
ncbi:hypothetical protein BD413DRAFT_500132 [Trametes elegans]|nr:hypothetical protein BD413DRAFT_500132 [Trametes elegans]